VTAADRLDPPTRSDWTVWAAQLVTAYIGTGSFMGLSAGVST